MSHSVVDRQEVWKWGPFWLFISEFPVVGMAASGLTSTASTASIKEIASGNSYIVSSWPSQKSLFQDQVVVMIVCRMCTLLLGLCPVSEPGAATLRHSRMNKVVSIISRSWECGVVCGSQCDH